MKRDLKFRAWDGEKMHEGVTPWRWDFVISNSWHRCEKSTGSGILGSGGDIAEMLVPAIRFKELMQFTGLKDKNGVEIYEGDIVKYKQAERFGESVNEYQTAVKYEGYGFTPMKYHVDVEDGFYSCLISDIEIIGNIYQNPSLLNH